MNRARSEVPIPPGETIEKFKNFLVEKLSEIFKKDEGSLDENRLQAWWKSCKSKIEPVEFFGLIQAYILIEYSDKESDKETGKKEIDSSFKSLLEKYPEPKPATEPKDKDSSPPVISSPK